jgi:hypothetical protein
VENGSPCACLDASPVNVLDPARSQQATCDERPENSDERSGELVEQGNSACQRATWRFSVAGLPSALTAGLTGRRGARSRSDFGEYSVGQARTCLRERGVLVRQ